MYLPLTIRTLILVLGWTLLPVFRCDALTVQFNDTPAVGQALSATITATGEVDCEDEITTQSASFAGTGTRTAALGTIPNLGFYRLTFTDIDTGEKLVCLVSALSGDASSPVGTTQNSSIPPDTLDKFLLQFNAANVNAWWNSWDKTDVLAQHVVQLGGTGTLLLLCVAAPPVACEEAALSGLDAVSDLTLDFLSHVVDDMVNVNHSLTPAEAGHVRAMLKAGKLIKSLDAAMLGNLGDRVLALVDAATLTLDPKSQLMIGVEKDAAGKANALISVVKKLP